MNMHAVGFWAWPFRAESVAPFKSMQTPGPSGKICIATVPFVSAPETALPTSSRAAISGTAKPAVFNVRRVFSARYAGSFRSASVGLRK